MGSAVEAGARAVRATQPAGSIYPPDFSYQPRFIEVNGRRLAYFDEGEGAQTIVMVHGNPVAGYVFAPLMSRLLPDFRCVVPDLLGFGMSEKPEQLDAYSLAGHIDLMAAFFNHVDLQDAAVLGHDWGGPIAFAAALQAPQRFSRLIVLNTMTEAPMKILPHYWLPFHILLRSKRLFMYLVRERGLFQRLGVAAMAPGDRAVYARANHNYATRAGIAAFPYMIPNHRRHPNYRLLAEILSGLKHWDIPSLVLFSDNDSVFTAEQGERFAQELMQARYYRIAGPKHFLQYEQPDLIGRLIRGFLGELRQPGPET